MPAFWNAESCRRDARVVFITRSSCCSCAVARPFLLTALIVWVETEGRARDLLPEGAVAASRSVPAHRGASLPGCLGVVRVLFVSTSRACCVENLRLMLGPTVSAHYPRTARGAAIRSPADSQPARRAAAGRGAQIRALGSFGQAQGPRRLPCVSFTQSSGEVRPRRRVTLQQPRAPSSPLGLPSVAGGD